MTEEHLDLIISLENSLAVFYEKLKGLSRVRNSYDILDYMETHSYEHAKDIEALKKSLKKPELQKMLIKDFQEKIKKSVFKEVTKQNELNKILSILANSEEAIGNLYKSIVQYLTKISTYYSEIARKVDVIAEQEYEHRDLILKEISRLAEKG